MKTIKANTYKGKQLLQSAQRNVGYTLDDVYSSYSVAKAKAWDWCYSQFASDNTSTNFRITSYNTFGFSVAWETEKGTRIETPNNSYLIVA